MNALEKVLKDDDLVTKALINLIETLEDCGLSGVEQKLNGYKVSILLDRPSKIDN